MEISIKGIGVYYTWHSWQTLLHWNSLQQLCILTFLIFTLSDLWKCQKKSNHFTTNIYIYGSQTFWSFMKLYFVHIVKVCFVFEKQSLCSKHWEMRKNNCKLNFAKNCFASWFSRGRLRLHHWLRYTCKYFFQHVLKFSFYNLQFFWKL